MKDILLMLVTLAMFAFGYFVVVKIDRFIEENSRMFLNENRQNKVHIRIAFESIMLQASIAEQLKAYSRDNVLTEIFLSSGKAERLLQKIKEGTLDIVILKEESAHLLDESYSVIRIPYLKDEIMDETFGLPVENIDEEDWAFVVWNNLIQSKVRDRILFTIETMCSQKDKWTI